MLFNSIPFLIFFPIVVLAYFVLPQKVRWVWLLAASLFFYACAGAVYLPLLLCAILGTYAAARLIEAGGANQNKTLRRCGLALGFAATLGPLFFFKYFSFAAGALAAVLAPLGITLAAPAFSLVLPVGISFYTFMSLGYVLDVWRGSFAAERNVFKYALFVSFFPQLLSGPIGRAPALLPQIHAPHAFEFGRVKRGLLLMLWGYFQKLVIADRLAVFVNQAYDNYASYNGTVLWVATLLFAAQIYCDFAGYSSIAIGAGEVLGYRLAQNFRRPYFATSIQDFWQRWHISLSAWFKDYLFFPLLRSRPLMALARALRGRLPKYYAKNLPVALALLVLWLATGLWHGAAWNYAAFGLYHGGLIILSLLLAPAKQRLYGALRVDERPLSYRFGQTLCTFVLVCLSWVFFRVPGLGAAKSIFGAMFTRFAPAALFDGSLYTLGLDAADFAVAAAGVAVLLGVSLLQSRTALREAFCRQNLLFQWLFIYAAIFAVLTFGVYGPGFDAGAFIYFQF